MRIELSKFLAWVPLCLLLSCREATPSEISPKQEIVGRWRYSRLIFPNEIPGLNYEGGGKQKFEFAIARQLTEMRKEREGLPMYRWAMKRFHHQIDSAKTQKEARVDCPPPAPEFGEPKGSVDVFDALHMVAKENPKSNILDFVYWMGTDSRKGAFLVVFDAAKAQKKYIGRPQYADPDGQKRFVEDLKAAQSLFELIQADNYCQWHRRLPDVMRGSDIRPSITGYRPIRNPYSTSDAAGNSHWTGTSISIDPAYREDLSVLASVEEAMQNLTFQYFENGSYSVDAGGEAESLQTGIYTLDGDGAIIRLRAAVENGQATTYTDAIRILGEDKIVIGSDQVYALYIRERP